MKNFKKEGLSNIELDKVIEERKEFLKKNKQYIYITIADPNNSWTGQYLKSNLHGVYSDFEINTSISRNRKYTLNFDIVLKECIGFIEDKELNNYTFSSQSGDYVFTNFNENRWLKSIKTFEPFKYKILKESEIRAKYPERLKETNFSFRKSFKSFKEIKIFLIENLYFLIDKDNIRFLDFCIKMEDKKTFIDKYSIIANLNVDSFLINKFSFDEDEFLEEERTYVLYRIFPMRIIEKFPETYEILKRDRTWVLYNDKHKKYPLERLFEVKDKLLNTLIKNRTEVVTMPKDIISRIKSYSHLPKSDLPKKIITVIERYERHKSYLNHKVKLKKDIKEISKDLDFKCIFKYMKKQNLLDKIEE